MIVMGTLRLLIEWASKQVIVDMMRDLEEEPDLRFNPPKPKGF